MTASFVAEVSSNHHRDLDRCLAFVDVAREIGCEAVKFQQFKIRELFATEALRHHPHLLEREAWELPEAFNRELASRAHERGLLFSSTPFYLDAVGVLEPHVDFFKVASYQVLWSDLLREVARTGKPVVLATGMATLEEVRAAVDVLAEHGSGPLTLLHCVSLYPTPASEANLAALETLREVFGCATGWSDHTVDADVIERAVRRYGAEMVEFHLDLDGRGEEFGPGHCWLPRDMQRVIANLLAAREREPELALDHPSDGDGSKAPRPAEAEERSWRTDPSDGLRPLCATRVAMDESAA